MSSEIVQSQDENDAVATVLDGDVEDLAKLLAKQPSLSAFVKDIQAVKEGLNSIEDIEAPPMSLRKKTSKRDRRFFASIENFPVEWYKNPYILSFGLVMAILFFYFCLIYFFADKQFDFF
jgi:hypothetical protein